MNSKPLILIADDEHVVHESLGLYLKEENFDYVSVFDGDAALEAFKENNIDLIILDIMMPGKTGIDVCKEVRRESNVPIIMLTAKGEEIDRILGLELGADDYIVKPFSPREVIARIKAVLRRLSDSDQNKQRNVVRYDGLEVNLENYQVLVDDESVAFTPKEVEILYLLASNPGQVFDRETILSRIWGYDYFGDTRTVDTHIKRIRQKINCDDHAYSLLTVYGVGYKFDAGSPA